MQIKKSQLIKEIQGLRGISIIAVMLFHFGLTSLPGGYIGVDMFFVISGFVIARLIHTDLVARTFSLGRFYKNRAVRLLPNLLAMILASIVISYYVLKPYDFIQYAKSLQFSGVYLTNMVFARQQGYFDISREVKPLLHSWSLSIEEQFYLFFPLLLMFWYKVKNYKFLILLSLLIVSFAAKFWSIEHDAINSFYSFPGRVWEFMIGALTAFAPEQIKNRLKNNERLPLLAILLIALSLLFLDDKLAYAGLLVFVPCVATAILIISSTDTKVGAVLSSKSLVFIGTISYSLYLWHWPILVLLRNSDVQLNAYQQLPILLAATAVISFLAWKYIEYPFHMNKNRYSGKRMALTTGLFTVFCAASGGYIYVNEGFESRFPSWVEIRKNLNDFNIERTTGVKISALSPCSLIGNESENVRSCALFGDMKSQQRILILGDSHVTAWYPAFDMAAQQKHYLGVYSSLPGCPPIFGIHSDDAGRNMCEDNLEPKLANLLASYHIGKVYLIANWSMYSEGNRINGILQRPTHFISDAEIESRDAMSSKAVMEKALMKTVAFFHKRNIEVVIVQSVPVLPKVIQDLPENFMIPLQVYQKQNSFMLDTVNKLQTSFNTRLINPGDVLCASGTCVTRMNGNVLYKDNNHISEAGAASLAQFISDSL